MSNYSVGNAGRNLKRGKQKTFHKMMFPDRDAMHAMGILSDSYAGDGRPFCADGAVPQTWVHELH